MEKRLALALALSVAFMLLWTWLFPPPKRPVQPVAPETTVTGEAAPATPPPAQSVPSGAAEERGDAPPRVTAGLAARGGAPQSMERAVILPDEATAADREETIEIDTPLETIRISNRGARIVSWRLHAYLDDAGEPLDLVSPAGLKLDHLPLQFLLQDEDATTRLREALYRVERHDEERDGNSVTEVSFTYSDGRGLAAAKVLRVWHDSYISELEAASLVDGRPVTPTLVWGAGFSWHDGESGGGYMGRGRNEVLGVVNFGSRIEHLAAKKVTPDTPWSGSGAIAWAGLEDKYFAALLLPETTEPVQTWVESLRLVEEGREHNYLAFALLQPGASRFQLFVGPKDYDLLKDIGHGLDKLVNFGFFSVIALPLFYALKFVERFTGNFGWAIAILTIVIRLIFFPFMHRGQLKMKKMQEKMKRVQPKVKAMRERYRRIEKKEMEKGRPGARQQARLKMNEEMMALYKTEGINPLGSMSGCLPLLVQMPILYGFYSILTISIELRKAPFMFWIRDLSQKDPYYVTPIVMGITMLLQQTMTSGSIPDPTQRRMMYIMPIMFTYFFINLPSGLVLYWLVNNILGIGQQYLVNKEAEAQSGAA